jgi:hypothetical protein
MLRYGFMMAPLKTGTDRAEDRGLPGQRWTAEESRREAWAGHVASLILAAFILFLLITCLHMFTKL